MPEFAPVENLFQLMYISSGTRLFSDQELEDILATARRKNGQLGISGMLLYLDGNFLQVLEGWEDDVHRLYAVIKEDARHHGMIVLIADSVERRSFADWSMGFYRPDRGPDTEILFNLTKESLCERISPDAPAQILVLMKTFYRVNRGQ